MATFLSVIIPVYNVAPYLRECLDSVSGLTSLSWEAIVVDDGSTDGSSSICDEYAAVDNRFKVIHQQNSGVAVARNAGLDIAQGEWIWFVDSDDVINSNFAIENISCFDSFDYILFGLESFEDGSDMPGMPSQSCTISSEERKNDFLMHNVCYHHPRLFYRRNVIERDRKIRFPLGVRVGEDLEFQYKYLMRCMAPAKLSATLYYYRQRNSSATLDSKYREKSVEDLPIVLEHLREWSKEECVIGEKWLEIRIYKIIQNLLYSASLVDGLDKDKFQNTIGRLIEKYTQDGWCFVHDYRVRLASVSVRFYFLFNSFYLKIRGLK